MDEQSPVVDVLAVTRDQRRRRLESIAVRLLAARAGLDWMEWDGTSMAREVDRAIALAKMFAAAIDETTERERWIADHS